MSEVIRTAASLIAARESVNGPEVLVVERSAASRFLPGYVVFPGGAVDRSDDELARAWFGSVDQAPRAAAVRELAEEAGLALTANGLAAAVDGATAWSCVLEAPPSESQLSEIARWIAPKHVPVRFDARYYLVPAAGGLEPVPDLDEAADAWWESPPTLLSEWRRGRRKLYWPTYFTTRALARCATLDAMLTLRLETREPDDNELDGLPRSTFWQD